MRKIDYIDEVENLLGELFQDKIDKPTIEAAINIAYNQEVFNLVKSGLRNFDLCRKRFTDIPVVWDSSAEVYYSTYPASIVPHINTEMIVSTIRGEDLRFYPSSEQVIRLTEILASNSLNNHIRTILKSERVEYYNMESMSDEEIESGADHTPKVSEVRMDLAIQFKDFLGTDTVYMPAGEDYLVIQLALDILRNEPIIDVRNE
jgi:hypothetical protein